jgi:mono/diheme cytochrome c family protein
VTGDEGRLARVILHGLSGDIEVAGTTYSGVMPGWGMMFKDDELAAVMTYIRSSWGNKAPAVRPETVARVRQESAGRTAPWTAVELDAVKAP